jgi:hypothetical protein
MTPVAFDEDNTVLDAPPGGRDAGHYLLPQNERGRARRSESDRPRLASSDGPSHAVRGARRLQPVDEK